MVPARGAQPAANSFEQEEPPSPKVKVVENGESRTKPEDCRGVIVGVGVNQPDSFPGYAGFVGWESPIRLENGEWLIGFNAGYWHASAPTPLNYSPKTLKEYRRLGLPADVVAQRGRGRGGGHASDGTASRGRRNGVWDPPVAWWTTDPGVTP